MNAFSEKNGETTSGNARSHSSLQFGLRTLFALTAITAAIAAIASRDSFSSSLFAAAGLGFGASIWALIKQRRRLSFWLSYAAVLSLLAAILLTIGRLGIAG